MFEYLLFLNTVHLYIVLHNYGLHSSFFLTCLRYGYTMFTGMGIPLYMFIVTIKSILFYSIYSAIGQGCWGISMTHCFFTHLFHSLRVFTPLFTHLIIGYSPLPLFHRVFVLFSSTHPQRQ